MRTFWALVVATLIVAADVSGAARQLKSPAAGTGVIAGRVIDARSGSPVAGAFVHLSQVNPPIGIGGRHETTTSDITGYFTFSTLPAGSFDVGADLRGYLAGSVGKLRANAETVWIRLDEGARTDVTVVMIPSASIGGIVVDERNTPIVGGLVEAWRDISTNGDPMYADRPDTAKTGTDGNYRVENLRPGRYVVRLVLPHVTRREEPSRSNSCAPPLPPPPPGAAASAVLQLPESMPSEPTRGAGTFYEEPFEGLPKPSPAADGSAQTYVSTFFPSAIDPRQSSSIALGPGENRSGVNLEAQLAAAVTVTGTLIRGQGWGVGNATRVELRRLTTEPESSRAEATAFLDPETRRFTFAAVPQGRYSMEITLASSTGCHGVAMMAGELITRQDLVVPAEGVKDVEVPIVEGQTLEGTITFAGAAARSRIDVWVTPLGVAHRFAGRPYGEAEGSKLTIEGLTPGRYIISAHDNADYAQRGRWFVSAISWHGRDLTVEPFAWEGPSSDPIEMARTDRPSGLKGVAVSANGAHVADATIIAFPTDPRLWAVAHPGMMRYAMARALGGQFEFRHLIPGDYFVAAVDERAMDAWPSAGFLTKVAAVGARVRMLSGQSQEIALPYVEAGKLGGPVR